MSDKENEQAAQPAHETPIFKSVEVEPSLKALKSLVTKLSKKPAPKKETPAKADNSTEEAATGGDGDEASPAGDDEGKAGKEGDTDEGEKEGAGEGSEAEADPLREGEL